MPTIEHALTLHGQGRLGEAESVYRSVLARDPQQFDALHLLGLARFQQGHPGEAFELLTKAVKVKPQSVQALSVLTAVLLALDRPGEALATCEQLLTINPGDLDTLYNRAVLLSRLGHVKRALAAYDDVLSRDAGFVDALWDRGNVLAQLSRFEEATASYDKVLQRAPGHLGALTNRGSALLGLGRHADALACYDKVLAIDPNHVHAVANRGTALKHLGRNEEALACYVRALALDPRHWNSLLNRGNALLALHRPSEALASYGQALAIAPGHADALVGRGNAQLKLNRIAEAIESYDRVLARAPDHRDALLNRGNALARLGRMEDALVAYERGLARYPEDAGLLTSLAGALSRLRRFDAAIPQYERALRIESGDPVALSGLVNALQEACDWDKFERARRELEARVDAGAAVDPLLLIRISDDPSRQLRCALSYVHAAVPAISDHPPARARRTSDRLRVAYLSADFRAHAMAHLVARLFELHDRSRFEIIGVSFGPDDRSAMRGRLVKAFDRFEDVARVPDRDIASLLRTLEVDIAVDLMGHTQDNRIGILAHRPAPIQVSYMGLPGTTGADFIDYFIADRHVLPFDQQPNFAERIVHLPDTYWVTDSASAPPPNAAARRELGLPDEGVVFCSFNQAYKITAAIFDRWMRLLTRVDGSVMWLLHANAAAVVNLRQQAKLRGVDPDRLVFAPRADITAHLARHRAADLFLDTLPVNAHTTASDALWMGVPVITCPGRTLAGRVAASLLHAVGLPELVTDNLDQYEARAFELASDRARLQALRHKLEANRPTCPLFDTDRFRRHVEAAFATMWEIHRRGERPRSFSV